MKKAISLALAAALCLSLLPLATAAEPITSNKRGTIDGFEYEYWSQYPEDPGSMTLTGGGTFECSWDWDDNNKLSKKSNNMLFRTGRKFDSTKSYTDYGIMTVEYAAQHTITKGSASYLTVYGWTENPLIEFYVVENYGSYKPPGNTGTLKGTIQVDGGTYEVYEALRVNQPSILGTRTFTQYFSVRVDRRTAGTITLTDHFKEWEKLGLDMSGTLYEISLCAEGYESAGSAKVTKHIMTIGDEVFGAPASTEPTATEPAATEPASTEPTATEPAATEPTSTDTPVGPGSGSGSVTADPPAITNTPAPTEAPKATKEPPEPEIVIAPNITAASKWAQESIQLAYNDNLIPESLQSNYTDTITRAEYCALTVRFYETVTGKTITETKTFSDTDDVNVQKLGGLGIVNGGGNGAFNPDGEFSRAEVAVMTMQLLNQLNKPLPSDGLIFTDNADIPAWARGAVGQMQTAGLMSGIGNNKFGPDVKYSREQGIMLSKTLWDKYT